MRQDRRDWVLELFGDALAEDQEHMISGDREFLLGDLPAFDSLRFLEVQLAVESLAGEDLPDALLSGLRTVEDCLATIESARARSAHVNGGAG